MSHPCLEFEVLDAGEASALAAMEALSPQFAVKTGPKRATRHTWLDTFDWRLHRAGLVLEHSESVEQDVLILTGRDGDRLTCPVTNSRWPSFAESLPPGAVRERVAEAAGIRALLPVAEMRSTVRHVQLLDDESKTVARVVVDVPSSRGRSLGSRLTHVSVVPVRGYAEQADKAARILSRAPGATANAMSVYERALEAADRQPQNYTKKVDTPLDPAMPAASAVATVLEKFLDVMEANVAGVVTDTDTEFLHDFRVAVRRTRATLKLTGDVLPDGLADRFAPEFKWLGDLTTPTRDLDVFLLGFGNMAAGLQAADPADLKPFRKHLQSRRTLEQRRLRRGLQSRRFENLLTSWRSELAAVTTSGSDAAPTALELAEERVGRAYRRVVKHGSAITVDSPGERLHTLRKRCKELRYLLEIFASLQDQEAHDRVVGELKTLQECLGDFQDGEVQRETVGEFATQIVSDTAAPAETVLAMGELSAQLEVGQRRARNDYADRFDRFTRRKNREAVAKLMSASAS